MLKVDYREVKLINLFEENEIVIIKENLPVGDVWLVDPEGGEPNIILERKTMSDLVASFNDGRYREQKNRLLEVMKEGGDKIGVGYIIEGVDFPKKEFSQCMGFMVNTLVRDKMIVYKSKDLRETYEFLLKMLKNWEKYKIKEKPVKVKLRCKREVLTPKIIFEQQLSLIPGVSIETAGIISEKYNDIKSLIKILEENQKEVMELKRSKMSKRRLGPKLVADIKKYLIPSFSAGEEIGDSITELEPKEETD